MSLDKDIDQRKHGVAANATPARDLSLSDLPSVIQYLASPIMVLLATAVAAGFERYETIPNLSLIYVLPVVISSVAFGLGPALFSALLGALAYNFFFTEPRFSLAVADTANIWAIALLFIVGCVTSTIVSTKRRDKAELDRFRLHQNKLQTYGRQMIAATSAEEATSLTRSVLASIFQAPVAVIFAESDEIKVGGGTNLTQVEIDAAKTAFESNASVAGGVYPFDKSRFDFWPARTTSDRTIVIGVAFDPERRPSNPDGIIEIVALMLGATIGRCEA